jgi:glucose-6-phosphate-specific signal transduction histidine kinase
MLDVAVADDGAGGADAAGGTGIRGLADRVEALGGRLELESPAGAGTTVRARLPLHPGAGHLNRSARRRLRGHEPFRRG